jgi:putative phosphoesterase
MKRIGILSDTHTFLDERVFVHFKDCDEIWHLGDFGSVEVADKLLAFKTLRAVYGNIDGGVLRMMFPLHNRFMCEEVDVWLTHIGGYPGNYAKEVKAELMKNPPRLFVTGHSHILKVQFDKKLNLLHINPGAEGKYGFHQVRTLVRLVIDGKDIKDLEVIELKS